MKNPRRNRKWLVLVPICALGMLVACSEEVLQVQAPPIAEHPSRTQNSELTVSIAKEWYEKNYPPVVTINPNKAKPELRPIKPDWENAKEYNRRRYEVVETPIKTKGSHLIMDAETKKHWKPGMENDFVRNVARIVVLKDKKTGRTRSFVMIFVGSYEYLQKSQTMEKNTYLYREPDFDGSVHFYQINGGFLNGWKYRNGRIIATISKPTLPKPDITNTAHVQNISTLDLLTGKEWTMQFPSKQSYTFKELYSKNEQNVIYTYNGEITETKVPFYLSDSIVPTFDSSKVGKIKNGKYIILHVDEKKKGVKRKVIKTYEIIKLTTTELILRNLNESTSRDALSTYKRE